MERGELIGSGKEAEVFAFGSDVLKLYRRPAAKAAVFREAATLAHVEAMGLGAPRVRSAGLHDGRWGLVMTRAPGVTLGELYLQGREDADAVRTRLVELQRRLHAASGGPLPSLVSRLDERIGRAELPEELRARLRATLAALPDGDRLCHGDFHPWNILMDGAEATIVDWLDACRGAPEADVCRSYVLLHAAKPDFARDYLDEYCAAAGCGAETILAWLPIVSAARLAEGVPTEAAQLRRWAEGAPA